MQKSKKTKNVNEKSIRKIDFLFHFLVLRSFIKQMNYHDDGHFWTFSTIQSTKHLTMMKIIWNKPFFLVVCLIDWLKKFINLLSVWICLKIPKKNLILSKQTNKTNKKFSYEILNIDYFLSVCVYRFCWHYFPRPFDSHPSIIIPVTFQSWIPFL